MRKSEVELDIKKGILSRSSGVAKCFEPINETYQCIVCTNPFDPILPCLKFHALAYRLGSNDSGYFEFYRLDEL